MRAFIVAALAAFACSRAAAGPVSAAEGTDLIEFVRLEDAEKFGWEALPGAVLAIAEPGRAGGSALRVSAGEQPKQYMGIALRRDVQLSGAGPADKIVFFIKQNFGRNICINMHTANGAVYRYANITQGQWSRVELDLDLAHWEHDERYPVDAWTNVDFLHIYSRGFDQTGEEMLMDGFSVSVDEKLSGTLFGNITKWEFPHETKDAWYLGNAQAAWAVSKTTGQVLGGWNAATKERYLVFMEGRYHLEDRKSLVTGLESRDTIVSAEFDHEAQRIELACSNSEVPDLTIRKRYWVDGNKLYQRIAFTTAAGALQFLTYNSQAAFVRAYRDAGYYMGGADGGGPLVPAPSISEWQKVLQYQNTAKGMLLHQPGKGYSFAHVRTRLDDRFVWPWFTGAIASYCERVNVLHYTPDGWDLSLGTSRLSQTEEISYEQYVSVLKGDWQTFIRSEYTTLPAVQEALQEIPPVPDWVGDVKVYTGSDIDRLRRLVAATDEGTIMVLVDFGGSWADYYVDRGLEGGWEGGSITAEEIRDVIRRIKAVSPRVKVGIYMWVLSTSDNTRIYREHPEWFRYANKDGEQLSTFPGMWRNFAHLLSIPECYDELLSQFDLVLGHLGTDFIYLDDPKAINMIDWESGEYTRDDLSFRFFLDIKRIAARHGPDKVVFFNNRGNPYADINFIEARATLRANYWRRFVGISAVIQEFVSSTRPRGRIIPLYYIPPHEREYMNRVLAMGWLPSMEYGDAVACRPFLNAAYEIGNCRNIALGYSPDWKRDRNTKVESYTVQRNGDKGYLLSFINHAEETERVPVEFELGSLALDRDGPVFVWEYVVADATLFKGRATDGQARRVYAQTGRQLDRATRRRLIYAGPYRASLQFELNMEPLLLHQLYLTSQPVAVYSEDDLPANYLFGRVARVELGAQADWTGGSLDVQIDSGRDKAEIVAFLPSARLRLERATLDGQPLSPRWVIEGDRVLPVLEVGKGRHTLAMAFAPGVADGVADPPVDQETGLAKVSPARRPGRRDIVAVDRMVHGLRVLRAAELTTSAPAGTFQPELDALMAAADPDALVLEAGTTRKIDARCRGAAFAGLEIERLETLRVKLGNTFHNAFHCRGPGVHVPNRPNSQNFAGIVVDYHTPAGYTKRVRLAAGVLHQDCNSAYPDYGRTGQADESYDLGTSMIEGPEQTFALDLRPYAPGDWDGRVWFSVGSHWVSSDRRLKLEILAANDAVRGDFFSVTDPRAFKAAYDKPRELLVPRSPGGIVIDGSPDEEMWRGAATTDQFFLHGGQGVSKAETTGMVLYDDTDLYIAFICREPARRKPLIIGGAIWDDDEVEVWIDANGDQKTYRQVIINAANEKMEYWESGQNPIGAQSAVYVDEGNAWMVEMTIPFAGLGVPPPKPGDMWRISLCRYRPPGEDFNSEMIVWAPLKQGGFKDLKNFGTLVFK